MFGTMTDFRVELDDERKEQSSTSMTWASASFAVKHSADPFNQTTLPVFEPRSDTSGLDRTLLFKTKASPAIDELCPFEDYKEEFTLEDLEISKPDSPIVNIAESNARSSHSDPSNNSLKEDKEELRLSQRKMSEQIRQLSQQLKELQVHIRKSKEQARKDFSDLSKKRRHSTKPLCYKDFRGGVCFRRQQFALAYHCRIYSFKLRKNIPTPKKTVEHICNEFVSSIGLKAYYHKIDISGLDARLLVFVEPPSGYLNTSPSSDRLFPWVQQFFDFCSLQAIRDRNLEPRFIYYFS